MNSAGNEGNNGWKYTGFPADADSVCAVGAVNSQGIIAGFSSRGYKGKLKPNIVSVGVQTIIAGLDNQPSAGNGTSFSCPNVAGLIACLWQAFPELNNMQLLEAVYRSSDRYTSPDSAYGNGIPNFRKAYEQLASRKILENDWIRTLPNPFTDQLVIYIRPIETGSVALRLMNIKGRVLKTLQISTVVNENQIIRLENLNVLPKGVYLLQYVGKNEQRTIKLLK
jgi:hypothetical protein